MKTKRGLSGIYFRFKNEESGVKEIETKTIEINETD